MIDRPCLARVVDRPSLGVCLQAWALFKGKFREGIDKADPPTWKTRLRCALNKSNDFEELVDRSQLDISDPYKVYRIIPEGDKRSTLQTECTFANREIWIMSASTVKGAYSCVNHVPFISCKVD